MNNRGKSGLFLMELMIALLIFALCACVCVAIIAKASANLTESRDMSNALILSQNKAELIKSGKETEDKTDYFDAELTAVSKDNSVYYSVSKIQSADNGVKEYTVEIYRTADDKLIYDINSAYYS